MIYIEQRFLQIAFLLLPNTTINIILLDQSSSFFHQRRADKFVLEYSDTKPDGDTQYFQNQLLANISGLERFQFDFNSAFKAFKVVVTLTDLEQNHIKSCP